MRKVMKTIVLNEGWLGITQGYSGVMDWVNFVQPSDPALALCSPTLVYDYVGVP